MHKLIIAKDQTVYCKVSLPVPGNLKVRAGEVVEHGALIAETSLPERYETIDIPAHFNVRPEQAEGMVKRLVGDIIAKGDVLAQKDGFITQLFRSPGDGKVVSSREGRITLAISQKKARVFSPLQGMVTELIDGKGAMISATGYVVEGAWCNGKNAQGQLVFWDELKKKGLGIPSSLVKDTILVLKTPPNGSLIRRLARLKPAGFIVPSLASKHLKALQESDVPVLSLLGFGEFAIDDLSLAMLETMKDKKVFLLADAFIDEEKRQPLLVMPEAKPADLGLNKHEFQLEPGAKVRLRGKPYTGMIGTVLELPKEPLTFASGLKSLVAVVECDDKQIIHAPIRNIDLIQD